MDATIIKAFLLLCLCVGGMGLLFYYLRKYGTKLRDNNSQVELKILGKASLQPKSHIFIIQAEGKKLLIGVTEHNINTLSDLTETNTKEFSEKEMIALQNQTSKPNTVNDLSFSSFLKSVVKSN